MTHLLPSHVLEIVALLPTNRDFSKIAELAHAEYLHISRVPKFSFSLLAKFTKLKMLGLDMMQITSTTGIGALKKLQSLRLVECRRLDDISEVAKCGKLRVFDEALCNKILNLDALSNCRELRYIRHASTSLQSLEFVRPLLRLRTLQLKTSIEDRTITPLQLGLMLPKCKVKLI